MCELLIQAHDKAGHLMVKRGDVIVACPDGWQWSPFERSATFRRLLAVPDMPEAKGIRLTAQQQPAGNVKPLHLRAVYLDLDMATGDFAAWLDDDERRLPMWTLPYQELRPMVKRREFGPVNPRMVGSSYRLSVR